MIKAQSLKGFRDFLPTQAKKRQFVIEKLKSIFRSFGYEPLETPALEYEEILLGKYGEEGDKLMYRFTDNGRRRVAMRYDQTVPLARVVALYEHILPKPFKRYQIQPVWRAEKPQKGRYREFLQCDVDAVNTTSPLSDAEILALVAKSFESLGFDFKIHINSRPVLYHIMREANLPEEKYPTVLSIIDKLDKQPIEHLDEELSHKGFGERFFTEKLQPLLTRRLDHFHNNQTTGDTNLDAIYTYALSCGIAPKHITFNPSIVRGLDYYTGIIFEVRSHAYRIGSLAGGGRYDKLISMFTGHEVPSVGVGFGFDRIIDAMEDLELFPQSVLFANSMVLVTIFSMDTLQTSFEITTHLRKEGISTEIYLGEIKDKNPLERQIKYALARNIPYVVIAGPEEIANNIVILKNLKTREQKQITISNLSNEII